MAVAVGSSVVTDIRHDYVVSGARLGLSDNTDDNAKVFTFALTDRDKAEIDAILALSRSSTMIMTIGDCGAEYRQKGE